MDTEEDSTGEMPKETDEELMRKADKLLASPSSAKEGLKSKNKESKDSVSVTPPNDAGEGGATGSSVGTGTSSNPGSGSGTLRGGAIVPDTGSNSSSLKNQSVDPSGTGAAGNSSKTNSKAGSVGITGLVNKLQIRTGSSQKSITGCNPGDPSQARIQTGPGSEPKTKLTQADSVITQAHAQPGFPPHIAMSGKLAKN
jgi:hypothetical protein